MNLVKTPYLPQGGVSVAIGDIACEGINIIKPYHNSLLPEGISCHADLSFCYLGSGVGVCSPQSYDYYKKALKNLPLELICGNTNPDRHYPYDVAYNVAIVGDKMFCKITATDTVVLHEAQRLGYKIIDINQGYAKCSACPVDPRSAISADVSFYKAATNEGIDVLLITNDSILLQGFSNGFFGGCAFMTDKSTLVVNGDITKHNDYEKIKAFLTKRGVSLRYTTDPVTDFGSFIPLCE